MIDDGYQIISAQYTNEEGTAIAAMTVKYGEVLITENRKELWEMLVDSDTPIAPFPKPEPAPVEQPTPAVLNEGDV